MIEDYDNASRFAVQKKLPCGVPFRFDACMQKQIHGHEVIHMMTEASQPFTRAALKVAIIAKFGPDARFHTCSAEGMDADGIIDFLQARGKFLPDVAGLAINPAKVCNHNH
jgi:probable metal-binding protein